MAASIRPVLAISIRIAVIRRSIVALFRVVNPERRHVTYPTAAAPIATGPDNPDSHDGTQVYHGFGPLAVTGNGTPSRRLRRPGPSAIRSSLVDLAHSHLRRHYRSQ